MNSKLDVDYLNLFKYIYNKYELEQKRDNWGFVDTEYETTKYRYNINNDIVIPVLSYRMKNN